MNTLFPIFLKLDQLQVLLVGAGPVGLEKVTAMLQNSPEARIRVLAERVDEAFYAFVVDKYRVTVIKKSLEEDDLDGVDLLVLATNNAALNAKVVVWAKAKHILLNVADKPDFCDFYLGSTVAKGDLKIGISTNGKSPTIAKRLKEFLKDVLPEEIDETLSLMHEMRERIKGDLQQKISILNAHTQDFIKEHKI